MNPEFATRTLTYPPEVPVLDMRNEPEVSSYFNSNPLQATRYDVDEAGGRSNLVSYNNVTRAIGLVGSCPGNGVNTPVNTGMTNDTCYLSLGNSSQIFSGTYLPLFRAGDAAPATEIDLAGTRPYGMHPSGRLEILLNGSPVRQIRLQYTPSYAIAAIELKGDDGRILAVLKFSDEPVLDFWEPPADDGTLSERLQILAVMTPESLEEYKRGYARSLARMVVDARIDQATSEEVRFRAVTRQQERDAMNSPVFTQQARDLMPQLWAAQDAFDSAVIAFSGMDNDELREQASLGAAGSNLSVLPANLRDIYNGLDPGSVSWRRTNEIANLESYDKVNALRLLGFGWTTEVMMHGDTIDASRTQFEQSIAAAEAAQAAHYNALRDYLAASADAVYAALPGESNISSGFSDYFREYIYSRAKRAYDEHVGNGNLARSNREPLRDILVDLRAQAQRILHRAREIGVTIRQEDLVFVRLLLNKMEEYLPPPYNQPVPDPESYTFRGSDGQLRYGQLVQYPRDGNYVPGSLPRAIEDMLADSDANAPVRNILVPGAAGIFTSENYTRVWDSRGRGYEMITAASGATFVYSFDSSTDWIRQEGVMSAASTAEGADTNLLTGLWNFLAGTGASPSPAAPPSAPVERFKLQTEILRNGDVKRFQEAYFNGQAVDVLSEVELAQPNAEGVKKIFYMPVPRVMEGRTVLYPEPVLTQEVETQTGSGVMSRLSVNARPLFSISDPAQRMQAVRSLVQLIVTHSNGAFTTSGTVGSTGMGEAMYNRLTAEQKSSVFVTPLTQWIFDLTSGGAGDTAYVNSLQIQIEPNGRITALSRNSVEVHIRQAKFHFSREPYDRYYNAIIMTNGAVTATIQAEREAILEGSWLQVDFPVTQPAAGGGTVGGLPGLANYWYYSNGSSAWLSYNWTTDTAGLFSRQGTTQTMRIQNRTRAGSGPWQNYGLPQNGETTVRLESGSSVAAIAWQTFQNWPGPRHVALAYNWVASQAHTGLRYTTGNRDTLVLRTLYIAHYDLLIEMSDADREAMNNSNPGAPLPQVVESKLQWLEGADGHPDAMFVLTNFARMRRPAGMTGPVTRRELANMLISWSPGTVSGMMADRVTSWNFVASVGFHFAESAAQSLPVMWGVHQLARLRNVLAPGAAGGGSLSSVTVANTMRASISGGLTYQAMRGVTALTSAYFFADALGSTIEGGGNIIEGIQSGNMAMLAEGLAAVLADGGEATMIGHLAGWFRGHGADFTVHTPPVRNDLVTDHHIFDGTDMEQITPVTPPVTPPTDPTNPPQPPVLPPVTPPTDPANPPVTPPTDPTNPPTDPDDPTTPPVLPPVLPPVGPPVTPPVVSSILSLDDVVERFGVNPAAVIGTDASGARGEAVFIELNGEQWVRKRFADDVDLQDIGLPGVRNELFFNELIRSQFPSLETSREVLAYRDGEGNIYFLTRRIEGPFIDPGAAYDSRIRNLGDNAAAEMGMLMLLFGVSDMRAGNVLLRTEGPPVIVDLAMAASTPVSTRRLSLEILLDRGQFIDFTRPELFLNAFETWEARLRDPAFRSQMEGMLRRSGFDDAAVRVFLENIDANAANFRTLIGEIFGRNPVRVPQTGDVSVVYSGVPIQIRVGNAPVTLSRNADGQFVIRHAHPLDTEMTEVELEGGTVHLGRSPQGDAEQNIILSYNSVLGRHLEISIQGDRLTFRDVGGSPVRGVVVSFADGTGAVPAWTFGGTTPPPNPLPVVPPVVSQPDILNLPSVLPLVMEGTTRAFPFTIPDSDGTPRNFEASYMRRSGAQANEVLVTISETGPDTPMFSFTNGVQFKYNTSTRVMSDVSVSFEAGPLRRNAAAGYAGAYAGIMQYILPGVEAITARIQHAETRSQLDGFGDAQQGFSPYTGTTLIPHSALSGPLINVRGAAFINFGVSTPTMGLPHLISLRVPPEIGMLLSRPLSESPAATAQALRDHADAVRNANPALAEALVLEASYREVRAGLRVPEEIVVRNPMNHPLTPTPPAGPVMPPATDPVNPTTDPALTSGQPPAIPVIPGIAVGAQLGSGRSGTVFQAGVTGNSDLVLKVTNNNPEGEPLSVDMRNALAMENDADLAANAPRVHRAYRLVDGAYVEIWNRDAGGPMPAGPIDALLLDRVGGNSLYDEVLAGTLSLDDARTLVTNFVASLNGHRDAAGNPAPMWLWDNNSANIHVVREGGTVRLVLVDLGSVTFETDYQGRDFSTPDGQAEIIEVMMFFLGMNSLQNFDPVNFTDDSGGDHSAGVSPSSAPPTMPAVTNSNQPAAPRQYYVDASVLDNPDSQEYMDYMMGVAGIYGWESTGWTPDMGMGTSGMPLYTGTASETETTGSMPLYTGDTNTGGMPLYTGGTAADSIPLYTGDTTASGMPLYTGGTTPGPTIGEDVVYLADAMPRYIEPEPSGIPLYTDTTAQPVIGNDTMYLMASMPLYVEPAPVDSAMPLYNENTGSQPVIGNDTMYLTASMPLYVEPAPVDSAMPLYNENTESQPVIGNDMMYLPAGMPLYEEQVYVTPSVLLLYTPPAMPVYVDPMTMNPPLVPVYDDPMSMLVPTMPLYAPSPDTLCGMPVYSSPIPYYTA